MGTAWSTGSSCESAPVMNVPEPGELLPADAGDRCSRYKATSYSNLPGVSSTTPLTLAPVGLQLNCTFMSQI